MGCVRSDRLSDRRAAARLLVAITEEQLKNAPDFMTRAAIVAAEEAAHAQQQPMDQQQLPAPTRTDQ